MPPFILHSTVRVTANVTWGQSAGLRCSFLSRVSHCTLIAHPNKVLAYGIGGPGVCTGAKSNWKTNKLVKNSLKTQPHQEK